MTRADLPTIQALRNDLSLQISRYAEGLGVTQSRAAKCLGVPQPTLSKIMNGRTSQLSLELLIRVAVRAGLLLTLQTGRCPEEAGVHLSLAPSSVSRISTSTLADAARENLQASQQRLTPSERLEAFLEHNQLMAALRDAGREADRKVPASLGVKS